VQQAEFPVRQAARQQERQLRGPQVCFLVQKTVTQAEMLRQDRTKDQTINVISSLFSYEIVFVLL
jgi:hypothetical protein